MITDAFLHALGLDPDLTGIPSLGAAGAETALMTLTSVCSALTLSLDKAAEQVQYFGAETTTLAKALQHLSLMNIPLADSPHILAMLTPAQSAPLATQATAASPEVPSGDVFSTAATALGDIDAQSVTLWQSWQRFRQDLDAGAFAGALMNAGSAIEGDATQLSDAHQEVVKFLEGLSEAITLGRELREILLAVRTAASAAAVAEALMAAPFELIAVAVLAAGTALYSLYDQWQKFENGITDGYLYEAISHFGELLVRTGALWRYLVDEVTEKMLSVKESLPEVVGGGLSAQQKHQLTQLEAKTQKGSFGYQTDASKQYWQERHETEAKAQQTHAHPITVLPVSSSAPLLPLSAPGVLRQRQPVQENPSALTPPPGPATTQFYITTMNVTADTPEAFARDVEQQADVVHTRHVSAMMNYERGKGIKP